MLKAAKDSPHEEYRWKVTELPSLDNDIHNLVQIMHKFGNLPVPFNLIGNRARKKIIKKLDKVQNIYFDHTFRILFGNLVGEDIWFTNTYILDYAPIYFGKHITVGPDVKLITSWHLHENMNEVRALPITLEDNVWLTMDIVVLPGVTIGENSVIAAGSIVTKSIPPNVMAGGNPCRVIKKINRDYEWWNEQKIDIADKIRNAENSESFSKIKIISYTRSIFNELRKQYKLLK